MTAASFKAPFTIEARLIDDADMLVQPESYATQNEAMTAAKELYEVQHYFAVVIYDADHQSVWQWGT